MSLTGKLDLLISLKSTVVNDLDTAVDTLLQHFTWTILNGTSADKADLEYHAERTLVASASEDIDLSPSPAGVFGAVTLVKAKAIAIVPKATNTGAISVVMHATAGVADVFTSASEGVKVHPGGCFFWAKPDSGVAVVATTGDKITITNESGDDAVYDIYVVGTSG